MPEQLLTFSPAAEASCEEHSLTFHTVVANSYLKKLRARGVTDVVKEFVERHPVNKFSSRDIYQWIEKHKPEVFSSVRPSALAMILRRLCEREELAMVKRPAPGRLGVYVKINEWARAQVGEENELDNNLGRVYRVGELCAGLSR